MTLTEIRQAAETAYQADPTTENLKALQAAGKAETDEYLARFDAREAAHREKQAAKAAETEQATETEETPAPYAAWFVRLLDEKRECTDTEGFENIAYRGYVSYGLSMSDGYYAAEDFDQWVTVFRKDPVGQLYHGNESRNALAPQALSYAAQLNS
jgi:hypothetical protein